MKRDFYSLSKVQTGAEPLALDDAKNYLRIDSGVTTDDDLVTALISGARSVAEKYISKAIVQQTVTMNIDYLPRGGILLPYGPVQSVTSIQVTDDTGAQTTWDASNYLVDTTGRRIVYLSTATFPASYQEINGVVVTYVAGYGTSTVDSTGIPNGIVQAIRHLVAASYENRETAVDVPPLVSTLLDAFTEYYV